MHGSKLCFYKILLILFFQVECQSFDLNTLNYQVDTVHTLRAFHAERRCCGSNFAIRTSICVDACPSSYCRPSIPSCESIEDASIPACQKIVCRWSLDPTVEIIKEYNEDCVVVARDDFAECDVDNSLCTRDYCLNGQCQVGDSICGSTAQRSLPVSTFEDSSSDVFQCSNINYDLLKNDTGTVLDDGPLFIWNDATTGPSVATPDGQYVLVPVGAYGIAIYKAGVSKEFKRLPPPTRMYTVKTSLSTYQPLSTFLSEVRRK